MTLFTTEKALNKKIVTLLRGVSLDDVDMKSVITSEDANLDFVSMVSFGESIQLKQSVIDSLLDAFDVEVCENKKYRLNSLLMRGITSRWDSSVRTVYDASVTRDVSFQGLRNEGSKRKRFIGELGEVTAAFIATRNEVIQSALDKLTAALTAVVNTHNSEVADLIEKIVVNLKVNDSVFDKVLSAEDKGEINTLSKETESIVAQIAVLEEKKKQNDSKVYAIKRDQIAKSLAITLGEKGNAMLAEINKEPEDEEFDPFELLLEESL
tara:strand:+ start:190 stop:990 length:801 start_codon:yes stop_codon:yes gene_type:complete